MVYDETTLLVAYGAIGIAAGLIFIRLIFMGGQRVYVLARESVNTFILQRGKIQHQRYPAKDVLYLGSDKFDIVEGVKPALIKMKAKSNKYHKFFGESNGQLVGFKTDMTETPDALMNPKDLAQDQERKSLAELGRFTGDKGSILQLILGVAVGVGFGYALFNNWHPGLVSAAPPGYTYLVQKINETATSVSSSYLGR